MMLHGIIIGAVIGLICSAISYGFSGHTRDFTPVGTLTLSATTFFPMTALRMRRRAWSHSKARSNTTVPGIVMSKLHFLWVRQHVIRSGCNRLRAHATDRGPHRERRTHRRDILSQSNTPVVGVAVLLLGIPCGVVRERSGSWDRRIR
jgi:hypothetical protein